MSVLRYIAILLSLVVLMQFNLLNIPACAEVVSVTPVTGGSSGGISGQLAVTKVGALIAADALAILNGTEIKIENHSHHNDSSNQSSNGQSGPNGTNGSVGPSPAGGSSGPSNSTDTTNGGKLGRKVKSKGEGSEPLLLGSLIQISTASHTLNGCAIFTGGKNFSRINLRACPDRVMTKSGKSYTGKITFASDKSLTILCLDGSHNIDYADIAEIHSGRAYLFSIPNYDGQSATMTLTPTCVHAAAAHGSTVKKVIIVGLALTIVAVAVAVPVGIAASHHHHSNTNNLILANYFQSKQTVPLPVMPTGTMMPTPQQLGASYVATLLNRPVVQPMRMTTSVVRASAVSSTSSTTHYTGYTGGFFSP